MQPLMSDTCGSILTCSLHLKQSKKLQSKKSRHSDQRLAPTQQERKKERCNYIVSQQGTYICKFADCICFHCNVILLQLLLDLIDALGDVFCLRRTNKQKFVLIYQFCRFATCQGRSSRTHHLQAPNLTHTHDLGEHLILMKLLINKKHHNSITKRKVHRDVSSVVSLLLPPPCSSPELQLQRFMKKSCSMEIMYLGV